MARRSSSKTPSKANQSLSTFQKLHEWLNEKQYGLLTFILVGSISTQFLFHSKIGDDWPNSQIGAQILWRYGHLNFTTVWNEISYWNSAWSLGQGRFFPMAIIENELIFISFRTQLSLNLFYAAVFALLCIIWIQVVKNFSGSKRFSLIFMMFLPLVIQFRRDFDPHISFGLLLPGAMIWLGLSILSLFASLRQRNTFSKILLSVLSGLLYLCGLCTYELVALLSPILIAVLFVANIDKEEPKNGIPWRSFLPITSVAVSLIGYMSYVFLYLRPRSNPTGAYVLGFDFQKSARTFLVQLVAAFPLSNIPVKTWFLLPKNISLISLCALIILVVLLVGRQLGQGEFLGEQVKSTISRKRLQILLLVSLIMLCAPAAMLSLQKSWWDRINWGGTYLGVLIEEFGVAILLATIVTWLEKKKVLSILQSKRADKR